MPERKGFSGRFSKQFKSAIRNSWNVPPNIANNSIQTIPTEQTHERATKFRQKLQWVPLNAICFAGVGNGPKLAAPSPIDSHL
jgi:hypothetical protein